MKANYFEELLRALTPYIKSNITQLFSNAISGASISELSKPITIREIKYFLFSILDSRHPTQIDTLPSSLNTAGYSCGRPYKRNQVLLFKQHFT